jgi:hypothetical protein
MNADLRDDLRRQLAEAYLPSTIREVASRALAALDAAEQAMRPFKTAEEFEAWFRDASVHQEARRAAEAQVVALREALNYALNQWAAYSESPRDIDGWGPIAGGDDDEAQMFAAQVALLADLTVASAARDARLQADARAAERERLRDEGIDDLLIVATHHASACENRSGRHDCDLPDNIVKVRALLSDSKEATKS